MDYRSKTSMRAILWPKLSKWHINLLLTWLLACSWLPAFTQKDIKFGKVSLEELQMTTYENDSSAGAVILSDIGRFNGRTIEFTRHIRVKILKKSGLTWGNWVFNTPTKGDFKVFVFNLVNGEIIKEKAANSSIYTEEVVDGFEVYKVFAPNVVVGSVIDIFYSHIGIPFEWRFQERIPVKFSNLSIGTSTFVVYNKTAYGFEKIQTISPSEWQAENMPAFKIEPFLNDYGNYITKLQFQIESIGRPGLVISYSTSWKQVIENLLRYERFGGVLNGSAYLNDFAKELSSKEITAEEKIGLAYEYIRENLKWNGSKTIFASANLKQNFKTTHSGNSAEINLSLIALLNKIGVRTLPVVLSTRDNGIIVPYSPAMDKLNYVIGYINDGDIEMMIDATSDYLRPGILPFNCLNGNGLIVKKDAESWLELTTAFSDVKRQFVSISLDPEAPPKATITQHNSGYGFLNWSEKRNASSNNDEIYLGHLQTAHPNVKFQAYEVSKIDKEKLNASEKLEVDISDQLVDVGNGFIFNPIVLFDYAENPFKAEERKYPVDFGISKEVNTTVVVPLPKNLTVKSVPQGLKLSNSDGTATFTYLSHADNNGLQFRVILKIDKRVFTEVEYQELRQFFSQIVSKLNEPVELLKST